MRLPRVNNLDTPSFGRSPRDSIVEIDVMEASPLVAPGTPPARGSSYDESGDVSAKVSDGDERGWKRNSHSTNSTGKNKKV